MPNERILVVDDKPGVCKRCAVVLEAHGYRVATVSAGKRALEVLRTEPIDVLLISLSLPDISGLEVYRLAQQTARNPVGVALTTRTTMKNTLAAFELGFSHFVPKPVDDTRLVEAVERALAQRRLLEEVARLKALHGVYEASRAILGESRKEPLCQLIAEIGMRETASNTASLMLMDAGTRELRLVAASGIDPALVDRATRKLGEPVAGVVAERGEMILLQSDRAIVEPLRLHLTRPQVSASLCAPLMIGDEVFGVLSLNKTAPGAAFAESDMELAAVLCGEGALALARVLADEEHHRNQRLLTIGTMMAGIVHDLRSPLTAIRGMADLVERQAPEAKEHCDLITHEVGRIVELMEGVLNYTRGETGLQVGAVPLGDFMRAVAQSARLETAHKQIEVIEDFRCPDAAPMDRRRLRRALMNLIHNACNAMRTGGRLTLRTYALGIDAAPTHIAIEVEDNGCGMTEVVKRRLFEPFFTQGNEHGTGLGTCIVKSIVDAHNGVIDVKSEVGKGTTIGLRLPLG